MQYIMGKGIIATADLIDATPEKRTEKLENSSEHETRIGCWEQIKFETINTGQGARGDEKTFASSTDMNKLRRREKRSCHKRSMCVRA